MEPTAAVICRGRSTLFLLCRLNKQKDFVNYKRDDMPQIFLNAFISRTPQETRTVVLCESNEIFLLNVTAQQKRVGVENL